jgi:two-component system NtrC family sensor kinase
LSERSDRERAAAGPAGEAAAADAESRLSRRAHELHVLGALARRAAEAETPEALFATTLAVLRREEPFDAALVARGDAVEIELSRPFSPECVSRLAAGALEVLGPAASARSAVSTREADDFDARRGERQDYDPAELVIVPVLRRGSVEACLAFLPSGVAGEAQVRILYSAANQLGLHLDRLLTAREGEAERLRAILDTMPQPVVLVDSRLAPLEANRSAEALLERLGAGPPGTSLATALERLGVGPLVEGVLADGRPRVDVEAAAGDGTTFSASVSPVGRTGRLVIVLTDVTESRRLQQRLAQTDKMSSLGQMISGTAHELNNPLASVLGYVQLLQAQVGGDAATERRLAAVATEAERCHRIVQNLLAFARQRPPERQPVSLNGVVQSVMGLMGYQLRTSGISVTTELAADLPVVAADAHQLQQVLVNLLTNSLHAIRGCRERGAVRLCTSAASDGDVVVEVHDDGPGVPAELRSRVFDPFFTTKDETQGTGLGLSIVYGIVSAHGGTIEVLRSDLGGACLRVALPPRAAPAAAARPASEERTDAPRAPGTILVVDDEAALRVMLCEALARDGHRAVAAADGGEALERLAAERFDLVVCDVRMPGLDARGLLGELRSRHPGLASRILLTSGDIVGSEPEELARAEGLELLHKPFGLDELRERVHRLLERT